MESHQDRGVLRLSSNRKIRAFVPIKPVPAAASNEPTAEELTAEIKQYLEQLDDQEFDRLLTLKFSQLQFRKRFKRLFIRPVTEC